MDETTRVPPASPLNKSGGGNKRSESPQSGGKFVPHYLRPSTGSCHEFCKHGKQEDRVVVAKDSRPWRKPASVSEDGGVTAKVKKTVVVKSKPSADNKTMSSTMTSEETMVQEMSTITEKIDLHSEETSSHKTTDVRGEMCTSNGPETTIMSTEKAKQETARTSLNITVAAEVSPLDVKDIKSSKKLNVSPLVKPSVRSPSPIFRSSTIRSLGGRKSLEERKSLDGMKACETRKSTAGRKNDEERSTTDESMEIDESKSTVPETALKCDGNGDNAGNNIEDNVSADKLRSIEGSNISAESNSSEERKNMKLKGKDDNLGKEKIHGKSEFPKKQVAVPTAKILKMKPTPSFNPIAAKPPSPLHPSSSPSRYLVAAKSPSPLHPSSAPSRNPIAAKKSSPLHPLSTPSRLHISAKPPSPLHPSGSPSRNFIAAKPLSPLHPSSSTSSKTIRGAQVGTQNGISKLEMKKVDTVTSPSSRPSVNGEEISVTKIVRVRRVVSTIRRQRRVTSITAKDLDDQGLEENTTNASKVPLTKNSVLDSNKEAHSDSLLPIAPSISKYAVRSRTSSGTSHSKNLPEAAKKIASKDASTPGSRKSKAVDLQPGNHRQSTLKASRVSLIGETARITRNRSLKKRISAGGNSIEKSTSGRVLTRRPSGRQKKNVQVLFNKVIEETASRLVRTSKSKVLALVGAFETVISIHKKSSSASTPKSKRISSSS